MPLRGNMGRVGAFHQKNDEPDRSADGQVSITGTLVKSLPVNFAGKAVFELQSYKQGVSEVSMQWIKPETNNVSERKEPEVYKLFITTK